MIYARAGDAVTCENGHEICRFAADVSAGQQFEAAHLTGWTQREPRVGAGIPVCATCGARFMEGMPVVFHFQDGWRLVWDGRVERFATRAEAEQAYLTRPA